MTREEKAELLKSKLGEGDGTWSLDRLSEETLDKIIEDAQIKAED